MEVTNQTGTLTTTSGTISATSANGIDITTAVLALTLTSVTTNGGNIGVGLSQCSGTFTANGGNIANQAIGGFVVFGGTVTVTYSGGFGNGVKIIEINNHDSNNITFQTGTINSNGNVIVQQCSGGIITFSNPTKTLSTGATTAVSLTNNTGATINFTGGGLAITTTTGTGFTATGGGTVTVQGTGNTISSTTGTALNMANTTIGTSGMTFQNISANGAANGIVLNTTGASGGLTVTGTGTAGSGGTVQNCTGNGVTLQNTSNTSLSWMNITGNDDNGIFGDELTGFSFNNCSVTNNADVGGGTEGGIRFNELYGTCTMSGTTVSGSFSDNVRYTPASGTLTSLNVSNCTFGPGPFPLSNGGNGFSFVSSGTAVANITMTGTTFTGNFASGFLTTVGGASLNASFSNCTFTSNNIGVDLGNGPTSDVNYSVTNCTFLNQASNAMNLVSDANSTTSAEYLATISNNTIGNGTADSGSMNSFGIAGDMRGDVQARISLTNNTIKNTDQEGIFVQSRLDNTGSGGTQTLSLTVRDNTVFTPDDNSAFPFGVLYGVRIESRNATELCLDISSNASASVGAAEHFRVRQRDTSVFRLERFSGIGTDDAAVAAFIAAQNDAGSTANATHVTTYTGVSDGFCPNP
ncbi:MAG: hypothetical protein IPL27_00495 [Lewinellaceae bacterium]|nr:hypothetical protein [Lewinellaceae bacterium]